MKKSIFCILGIVCLTSCNTDRLVTASRMIEGQKITYPGLHPVENIGFVKQDISNNKMADMWQNIEIENHWLPLHNDGSIQKSSVNFAKPTNKRNIRTVAYVSDAVQKGIKSSPVSAQKFNMSQSIKGDGSGALRTIGWIILITGLIFLLAVSILLGALLMLLGLIFVIAGRNTTPPAVQGQNENKLMEDVVYLKNGSIIRGLITEQVPNDHITIKIKGGSLFVYKMDDVEKITKEEVAK